MKYINALYWFKNSLVSHLLILQKFHQFYLCQNSD